MYHLFDYHLKMLLIRFTLSYLVTRISHKVFHGRFILSFGISVLHSFVCLSLIPKKIPSSSTTSLWPRTKLSSLTGLLLPTKKNVENVAARAQVNKHI